MALTWIDNHCHIGGPYAPEEVLDAAREGGVVRFVVVACDRSSAEAAIALAAQHDDVVATVGLHPHEASHGTATVADLLDTPGIAAIGECGLDYHYDHSPRDQQRVAFAEQIGWAHERKLPLVVHSRTAWDDTFAVLESEGVPEGTVIHCFTGGPAEAERCLALGAYLSFSGIVTFKAAKDVQAAAELCPLDRLLVETDSPFLAPVPHRGKPNQPLHVRLVGEHIATLRDVPAEVIADATRANAESVYSLT